MRFASCILIFLFATIAWSQEVGVEYLTVDEGLSQGMIFDMLQSEDDYVWIATKDGLNRFDGHNFRVFTHNPSNEYSLASNQILAIHEDRQGLIWVFCESPYEVQVFNPKTERFHTIGKLDPQFNQARPKDDVPYSQYFQILVVEDHDGNLWLSGPRATIFKINVPKDLATKLESNSKQLSEILQSLVRPVFKLPKIVRNLIQEQKDDRYDIAQSMIWSKSNKFYIGTLGKIYEIDPQNNDVQEIYSQKAGESSQFRSVIELLSGEIWFCGLGNSKICAIKNDQVSIYELTGLKYPQIENDKKNNIYISTEAGTYVTTENAVKTNTVDLTRISKSNDGGLNLNTTMIDKADVLWLGSRGFGLMKRNLAQQKFNSFFKNQSIKSISPYITNKKGAMLTLPHNTHASIDLEQMEETMSPFNCMLPKSVRSAVQSPTGEWFYIEYNLNKRETTIVKTNQLTGKTERIVSEDIKDCERSKLAITDKYLWLLSGKKNALLRIDQTSFFIKSFPLKTELNDANHMLLIDARDDLFACTSHGLLHIKLDESKEIKSERLFLHDINNEHSLSHNFILSVADDPVNPESFIWVGTKGGGINKLNKKTGHCIRIGAEEGLPDQVAYGILSDNQNQLWISSNKGLSRYNPKNEKIVHFNVSDGLQASEFNKDAFAKLPTGELAFGGVKGLNIFNPDSIRLNDFAPRTVITSIKVNADQLSFSLDDNTANQSDKIEISSPVDQLDYLELAYDENLLNIEYSALDFASPKKNQYQYILEGHDKEWNEVGNIRRAIYSNLPHGEYTFKVKSSNIDGIWSTKQTELQIKIWPPWWKTKLAFLLYALTFLGLIYFIYQRESRRIKLQNQLAFEKRESDRLNEIDRIKSNFFSNITHELRTPLTLIIEPLRQIIGSTNLKEERIKDKLHLVKNNSENLLKLVNQLLDLSKIEGGKMQTYWQHGDIAEVIRPIEQSVRVLTNQKGIDFKVSIAENIGSFYFDKAKVEKIISNLLSNAIKFTSEGWINVQIASIMNQENQKQLSLSVEDTGIGIPENQLNAIFDRFHQADDSFTRQGEGSGIGLALVKELTELLGGRIQVKSEFGQGSTFTVLLPMQLERPSSLLRPTTLEEKEVNEKEQDEKPAQETTANVASSAESDRALVLLVEDNKDLRYFIRMSLEENFDIVEAKNGEHGIAMAKEHIPDLVISDLMMPKKDGLQLTAELKRDELTSHVPIILLTAKSAVETKIQGLQQGADAYLTKPFHTEELVVRISKLINLRRTMQEKFSQQLYDMPVLGSSETKIPQIALREFSKIDNDFLTKLISFVDNELSEADLSVESLSKHMFISRSQLFRKVKALTGDSPSEFIRNRRLDRAKEMLMDGEETIAYISDAVGFADQKYFATRFKARFGVPPSQISI